MKGRDNDRPLKGRQCTVMAWMTSQMRIHFGTPLYKGGIGQERAKDASTGVKEPKVLPGEQASERWGAFARSVILCRNAIDTQMMQEERRSPSKGRLCGEGNRKGFPVIPLFAARTASD